MELVSTFILMVRGTVETGSLTNNMDSVRKFGLMALHMKVSLNKVKKQVKVPSSGLTTHPTQERPRMTSFKVKDCILTPMAENTMDNFSKTKCTDTESLRGLMDVDSMVCMKDP
jgi:hypothetical protein